MKHVLITGGAGYIGAELSARLLNAGFSVTIYDRFFFGNKPIAPLAGNRRLNVVEGDIRDTGKIIPLLEKGAGIVHLASLSNDPSCDLDPQWSVEVNHKAAVRLAEAAKRAGCIRFVFASSCSVYGFGGGAVLTENSPLNPVSLYARLKTQTEAAILEMGNARFSPVILRQATIFGLSPRMRFDLAINQMTLHAITRGKIFVLGGGGQWRPFLHVRDAALAFHLALEAAREKVHCGIFNTGSNENNFQIADLAARVQREIGNVEIEVAPEDADRRDYHVDFSKIRETLDFRPQVDISRGIREVAGFIRLDPARDYNTGEFFNIKKMKEFAEKPAISGGEPVRYSLLAFPSKENALPHPRPSGLRSKKGHFDFTRAGEALRILLGACGIHRGDEVLLGTACDAWVPERLKKLGLKVRFIAMAPRSFALSVPSLKENVSRKTKAVFFSEFDGPDAFRSADRALKVVVSAVWCDAKADVIFWKCDVRPGIAGTPAVRVIARNEKLKGSIRKGIARWMRDWQESPAAGPAISAEFDRFSNGRDRMEEITGKIKAAVNGRAMEGGFPAGRMGIVFDNPGERKRFIASALAERVECLPLPEGWAVSFGRGMPCSAFLPITHSANDNDVSDMVRVLRKLL